MLTHHTCTTEIEEVFGTGTRLKSLNKAISRQSSHRCHNMTPAYYYYFITAGIATSMLPWDRERQGYVRAGPLRCHLHEQPQHLEQGGAWRWKIRCARHSMYTVSIQGRDEAPRGRDQSLPSHAYVYTCACIDARTPKAIILRTASSRLMQKEGSKTVSPASWGTIASLVSKCEAGFAPDSCGTCVPLTASGDVQTWYAKGV